ncbi:MAG: IMP cyclohydrolase [Ruminococcus sp.]|jgi:IMP cyclohydrolase|nr:IMP cyclohydrolase [Ruminococcus sp.]
MKIDIKSDLQNNAYPGRGIIIGKHSDNTHGVIAYFIMGRSENSRNRIFTKTDDGIRTEAFDPSKMQDPSLVIYSPVRVLGNKHIVTNGDQTDTIVDFMDRQYSFEEALQTRTFEPDPPIFTPRISGIVRLCDGDMNYALSILKSADGDDTQCRRFTFTYKPAKAGTGHFIHTYAADGNPPPSFYGEPKEIEILGNIDEFSNLLWDNLNTDNKISLFTRFIDLQTGQFEDKIINKLN